MPDYNVYQQPIRRVDRDGDIFWELPSGKLHRLDGPAEEYTSGYKAWYVNGKHHRLDGPAVEDANSGKAWWVHGKRHRLDGPAIEYTNGGKGWFIDGQMLTEQQWTLEVCRRFRDESADFG